ncbi:ASST-domain-containing protein [Nemania serpens]|nr:ASST-domain-containing protein [Nemania serpens]
MFGKAYGYGMILDDRYRVVKTVQTQGGMDIHEFRPINGGQSALVTKYGTRPFDFAGIPNPQGLRIIAEGVFEEIDLETDDILFRWRSLDHIRPTTTERRIEFDKGQSAVFDYFHINGVDKNGDGDYLISARNTSAVYKISGVDGHVIWTLSNGPESDFQLDGFVIWGAHHARWRSENATQTIFTLFNNGWDGNGPGTDQSSGLVIAIDHKHLRASVMREYGNNEKLGAVSKGSMQTLPGTNNVLIGWGSEPHLTEYLEDGTLVFHATIAGGGDTYRVFKQDWAGNPSSPPTLWTYARTRDPSSPRTAFYVSWNGATGVVTWNFYVGGERDEPRDFTLAGSSHVSGFETVFSQTGYRHKAFAEAVAADGRSLGNSSVISPWTPDGALADQCDEWHCPERESEFRVTFNLLPDLDSKKSSFYNATGSTADDVQTGQLSWIPPVSVAFLSVESTVVVAAVIVTCSILTIAALGMVCGRRKSWIYENL